MPGVHRRPTRPMDSSSPRTPTPSPAPATRRRRCRSKSRPAGPGNVAGLVNDHDVIRPSWRQRAAATRAALIPMSENRNMACALTLIFCLPPAFISPAPPRRCVNETMTGTDGTAANIVQYPSSKRCTREPQSAHCSSTERTNRRRPSGYRLACNRGRQCSTAIAAHAPLGRLQRIALAIQVEHARSARLLTQTLRDYFPARHEGVSLQQLILARPLADNAEQPVQGDTAAVSSAGGRSRIRGGC